MVAAAEDFDQVRGEAVAADPYAEHIDRVNALVQRVLTLWDAQRTYHTSGVPGHDRDRRRAMADILRSAERAMTAVIPVAATLVSRGHHVDGFDHLMAVLFEARAQIALPLARRMAARDPEGRTADELARLLARTAQFSDGRPVITESLAARLPCPFDPEPVA